jgi:methionyl aminopeptidase
VPNFLGYHGFTGTICASINNEIVHGIPSRTRVIRERDLVSLDFGSVWDGFVGDSAVTVVVGEAPSAEAEKLVRVTEEALEAGIAQIRPGGRLSDISHAVQQVAEGAGFSVVREYVGHGIGQEMHERPEVPNFGARGKGAKLKRGMTLALEPMVTVGSPDTLVTDDGWTVVTEDGSLAAHWEHTIAITESGPEILTLP